MKIGIEEIKKSNCECCNNLMVLTHLHHLEKIATIEKHCILCPNIYGNLKDIAECSHYSEKEGANNENRN